MNYQWIADQELPTNIQRMKLYNLDNSPFATRVRIQIRHKQIPIEICPPPLALRSDEFKAAYPLGKLPVLDLLDGNTIGESVVIMNYLERLFPDTAMRPDDPLAKAHDEMLLRYTDNHLAMSLSPLFQTFFVAAQSGESGGSLSADKLDPLKSEILKLDQLLNALPSFKKRSLYLGDLCLASHVYYVAALAEFFGLGDILQGHEHIEGWRRWVAGFSAVTDEIAIMNTAHLALLKSFGIEL